MARQNSKLIENLALFNTGSLIDCAIVHKNLAMSSTFVLRRQLTFQIPSSCILRPIAGQGSTCSSPFLNPMIQGAPRTEEGVPVRL